MPGKAFLPIEWIILVVAVVALIFSGVTLSSLEKIKTSCGASLDKKHYDSARNSQIVQIVLAAIVLLLSGYVIIAPHAGGKFASSAQQIRDFAHGLSYGQ